MCGIQNGEGQTGCKRGDNNNNNNKRAECTQHFAIHRDSVQYFTIDYENGDVSIFYWSLLLLFLLSLSKINTTYHY